MSAPDSTPPAHAPALFDATLKHQPADFIVDEQLDIAHEGHGEHLYLQIRKVGMNTQELVSLLEQVYNVRSQDVGFAGMKDRQARTTQWFSVTTPEGAEPCVRALERSDSAHKSASVLNERRHTRKLRRGAHSGNRFVITLRQVQACREATGPAMPVAVAQRLECLSACGFPNYIGPQRFGRGGQNLQRARQWFRQPRKRATRQQRSLWLSAGRSAIFNAVCAERVRQGNWQTLLTGEPAILAGTHSFFDTEGVDRGELDERLGRFDIHPSAPWWGRGSTTAKGDCAALEGDILADFEDICAGLERAGLSQERRSLRAQVYDLSHQWVDADTLELTFSLSPGIFATTFLNELGRCQEPDQQQSGTE